MSLVFAGTITEEVIPGPWTFTFPVTAQADRYEFTVSLRDSQFFTKADIVISPMATTIDFYLLAEYGEADNQDFLQLLVDYLTNYIGSGFGITSSCADEIFITLKDGSEVRLFTEFLMTDAWGVRFTATSLYFNISDMYSITLLGVEYPINAD